MRRSTILLIFAFALGCIARPCFAQEAGACVDEVQRLDEGLPVIHDQANEVAIAREPGARKGASLGDEERRQVSALIEQARTAGAKGDGGRCMRSLTEARALLREAGFGSGAPGSASDAGLGTGLLGTGTPGMAGGAGLPAPPRGAGAATAGVGGDTTDMGAAARPAGPRAAEEFAEPGDRHRDRCDPVRLGRCSSAALASALDRLRLAEAGLRHFTAGLRARVPGAPFAD